MENLKNTEFVNNYSANILRLNSFRVGDIVFDSNGKESIIVYCKNDIENKIQRFTVKSISKYKTIKLLQLMIYKILIVVKYKKYGKYSNTSDVFNKIES